MCACAMPELKEISNLLDLALKEDLGQERRDLTSDLLFSQTNELYTAHIINKSAYPVTISGSHIVRQILHKLNEDCQLESIVCDGETVAPGGVVMKITGPSVAVLQAERTILNFLRHLSAIATLTKSFVEKVMPYPLKILDTRKTTPGLRWLEKYAVTCGGGVNHRMGLYDAIMVKDTHVDRCQGVTNVLDKLKGHKTHPIIFEVRNLDELDAVLQHGVGIVDRILLDNMDIATLTEAVKRCAGKISTEASGNINLETIEAIAKTGVNYASIGMLTHSAGNVDLSMIAI